MANRVIDKDARAGATALRPARPVTPPLWSPGSEVAGRGVARRAGAQIGSAWYQPQPEASLNGERSMRAWAGGDPLTSIAGR